MPSIVSKNTRYYYEIDKDGNKVLRHILIGTPDLILQVPADGVTIDVVPPNSVGTEEIKDQSVQLEDLAPEVTDQMADRVTQDDLDKFKV